MSTRIARPSLRTHVILSAVALGVALIAPGQTQADPPQRYVDLVFDQVARTNDVRYGTAIDKPTGQTLDLLLDIYEPRDDAADRRPVFVFLFGGGFVAGNKELEPRVYCEQMARRGYVAVAPSYRLRQGDVYRDGIPAAVSDARQAVAWLRENAELYRLDTNRIAIGGSSAGAITSLFVAYTDWELEPGDDSSQVAIVLDLWGGLYTEVRQMQAGEPPLAIIHGTQDQVVAFSEAEKLRDRAAAVGVPYLFHPLVGEAHAPYKPVELMAVVAPFFYEHLWPDAPTPSNTPVPTDTATPTATPTLPATDTPTPGPTKDVHLPVYLPSVTRG